jgi:hypothetical protein
MVKIINISPREMIERERACKLHRITIKFLGSEYILNSTNVSPIIFYKSNNRHAMTIFPYDNRIDVVDPNHFDKAVKLAQLYESQNEPEFIVKRNYSI